MENSRSRGQLSRGGYASHATSREPESEEERQLLAAFEKFRGMKSYLKKRRRAIEISGRQLELADMMEEINEYLNIIDDFLADTYIGIETINGYIEKVQEMMRDVPLGDGDCSDDEDDKIGPSLESPFHSHPQSMRIAHERERNDWGRPAENLDNRHLANDIWSGNRNKINQFMRRSVGESQALNYSEVVPGEKMRYGRGRGAPMNTQRHSDADMDVGRRRTDEFDNEINRNDRNYIGRGLGRGACRNNEDEDVGRRRGGEFDNETDRNDRNYIGRSLGRGGCGNNEDESSWETFGDNRPSTSRGRGRNMNFRNESSTASEYPETNYEESPDNCLFERRPRTAAAQSRSFKSTYDANRSDLNDEPAFQNESSTEHLSEDSVFHPRSTFNNSAPAETNRNRPFNATSNVPNSNYNIPNVTNERRSDNNSNLIQQSMDIKRNCPPNATSTVPNPNYSIPNVTNERRSDNNSNLIQQSINNHPITAAAFKEAVAEGIKEALMQQGNISVNPALINNRALHTHGLSNFLHPNINKPQPHHPNFNPNNVPHNNRGMGFIPQPNRYPTPTGYPSTNNFGSQPHYPTNPSGSFRHPSPNMNFRPQNFGSQESINSRNMSEDEMRRQFREKAKNHFNSPGIRIRPRNGPPQGPTPPPSQNFPARKSVTPTPYRNSQVTTNQMVAEPRNFDPRLNRARNHPVANRNETLKNNQSKSNEEPADIADESEPSTSNKRRIGLAHPKDLPKTLSTTRNKVISELPKTKVDKINKLSEFKKKIENEGVIRLGNKNSKSRNSFQDALPKTLPNPTKNKSHGKERDDDDRQNTLPISAKNKSHGKERDDDDRQNTPPIFAKNKSHEKERDDDDRQNTLPISAKNKSHGKERCDDEKLNALPKCGKNKSHEKERCDDERLNAPPKCAKNKSHGKERDDDDRRNTPPNSAKNKSNEKERNDDGRQNIPPKPAKNKCREKGRDDNDRQNAPPKPAKNKSNEKERNDEGRQNIPPKPAKNKSNEKERNDEGRQNIPPKPAKNKSNEKERNDEGRQNIPPKPAKNKSREKERDDDGRQNILPKPAKNKSLGKKPDDDVRRNAPPKSAKNKSHGEERDDKDRQITPSNSAKNKSNEKEENNDGRKDMPPKPAKNKFRGKEPDDDYRRNTPPKSEKNKSRGKETDDDDRQNTPSNSEKNKSHGKHRDDKDRQITSSNSTKNKSHGKERDDIRPEAEALINKKTLVKNRARDEYTSSRTNSSSTVSNVNEVASEDEQGSRTTGADKVKCKKPKLNENIISKNKEAMVMNSTNSSAKENKTEKLLKKFILDNVKPSDIEKLINPKTFQEVAKRLQDKLAELTTITNKNKTSSSSTAGNLKSHKEGRQMNNSPVETATSIQNLLQQTLHSTTMTSAVPKLTPGQPRASTSNVGRQGQTVRKPKLAKDNSNLQHFIPDAKKVGIMKCRTGKRGRTKSSDGAGVSFRPQRRYMTRLQVRKISEPEVRRRPFRTGWEKWSKKLEKQNERRRKFGILFSAWKKKQNLKILKRGIGTEGDSQIPTKKPRNIVGPNFIVVNPGLGKIKIESDYLAPTIIKTENEINFEDATENSCMNHICDDAQVPEPPPNSVVDTNLSNNEDFSKNSNQKDNNNVSKSPTNQINYENVSKTPRNPKNNEKVSKNPINQISNEDIPENLNQGENNLSSNISGSTSNDVAGPSGSSDFKLKIEKTDLNQCTKCSFVGDDIVFHYVNNHPDCAIPQVSICPILFAKLKEENESTSPQRLEICCTEKLWPCLYCEETFKDVLDFFGHLATHTGEYQYACAVCSTRYPDIKKITTHLKTHKLEGVAAAGHIRILEHHTPKNVFPGGNELLAFFCNDCCYFQLFHENIARHLENENHSPNDAISVKFYNPKNIAQIKKEPGKNPIKKKVKKEMNPSELLTESELKDLQSDWIRLGST